MKPALFGKKLLSFAKLFDAVGAQQNAKLVRQVSLFVSQSSASSIATGFIITEPLKSKKPSSPFGKKCSDLEPLLVAISETAEQISNKAFIDDLKVLLTLVSKYSHMNLSDFFDSLRLSIQTNEPWKLVVRSGESRVDAYLRELEAHVHDPDIFPDVFAALRADREMKKLEVVELANKFAFLMPSGVTKTKALEYIGDQHRHSERARLKNESQAGKSAA